jgi:hypothetical protein
MTSSAGYCVAGPHSTSSGPKTSSAPAPTTLPSWHGPRTTVLTHDAATMVRYAYERVDRGEAMPGVVIIRQALAIAAVIEEVLLLVDASDAAEWAGRVVFLPL